MDLHSPVPTTIPGRYVFCRRARREGEGEGGGGGWFFLGRPGSSSRFDLFGTTAETFFLILLEILLFLWIIIIVVYKITPLTPLRTEDRGPSSVLAYPFPFPSRNSLSSPPGPRATHQPTSSPFTGPPRPPTTPPSWRQSSHFHDSRPPSPPPPSPD